MAIFVCLAASLVLWLVELRYIILFYGERARRRLPVFFMWCDGGGEIQLIYAGWFKSMKGLFRPHHVSTVELIEFLSRAPTDAELVSLGA